MSESAPVPSWRQRYVCPQCPAHRQPTDGYGVVEFQEHVFAHAIQHLSTAAQDAHQYRYSLEAIDDFLKNENFKGWPAQGVRLVVQHRVDNSLRRFDDAHWKKDLMERAGEATRLSDASYGSESPQITIQEYLDRLGTI